MSSLNIPKVASPAHVLLVCHNRSGLAARKAVLEEIGCRITPAASGEEALECFGKSEFDLVVTDYRMSRMDGIELIREIRLVDQNAKVILLSGHAEALGLTAATTNADAVLTKSANEVSHLVRAVLRLLRQKTVQRKPVASTRGVAPKRNLARAAG
jgi:CheY-like chemotaxis protein